MWVLINTPRLHEYFQHMKLTNLVLWVLQVEHERSVLVLVSAVSVHVEVEHLLLYGDCQFPHLTLRHGQVVAVTYPKVKQTFRPRSFNQSLMRVLLLLDLIDF